MKVIPTSCNLQLMYNKPFIQRKKILCIHTTTLKRTYRFSSKLNRSCLVFSLLATLDKYERAGDKERAAHLAYLLSFYFSELLMPPGAKQLALRYAERAVKWNPIPRYEDWKIYVLENQQKR